MELSAILEIHKVLCKCAANRQIAIAWNVAEDGTQLQAVICMTHNLYKNYTYTYQ